MPSRRSPFYAIALLLVLHQSTAFSQQAVFIPKKVNSKKNPALDSNGWRSVGVFILNVNQSARSDWGGGGEDFLIGVNAIFNKAIHHKKDKYSFDVYADIEQGFVEATSFRKIRKTSDRFDLTAEVEHSIGSKGHWNYALLGNFNTQIFDGHNYFTQDYPKISSFLSPGKFLLSAGFDNKYSSPAYYLSFFISPATIRWVTKFDPDFYASKKYGVDPYNKVNTEIGAYFSTHLSAKLSKTTDLLTRLDLFSNYKHEPENVDLLFNCLFTFGINKFLSGSFLLDILYDHDFRKRTQVQEITGLGLRLKL